MEFWVDFMFLSLFWDIFEKYENLILNSYKCLVDRIWLLLGVYKYDRAIVYMHVCIYAFMLDAN